MKRWTIPSAATSILFAPGHALDVLGTPGAQQADIWVLDLEDTVPASSKPEARKKIDRAISDMDPDRRTSSFLRPNADRGEYIPQDLQLAGRLAGIVVPKVNSAADIRAAANAIDQIPKVNGHADYAFIATIETAKGVLHAEEILEADERIVAVVFGPSDLTLDLGVLGTPTHEELSVPRALVALCAAAAGVVAIDGGFGSLGDIDGLARDIAVARQLGYRCKLTTFAPHVPYINSLLKPTEVEVAWASQVLARTDGDVVSNAKARLVMERAKKDSS